MRIFGIILMIVGAIMTFFVGSIIKSSNKKLSEDDEDFGELLSMSALVFKTIGFGIAVIGCIIFFLNTK